MAMAMAMATATATATATRKRHTPQQVVRKLTQAHRMLDEGKEIAGKLLSPGASASHRAAPDADDAGQ
jgi:hypothetical protein